jgi:monoterpene epsilon-lactone hydrolase
VRPSLDPRVPVGVQRRWNALLAKATMLPGGTHRERVDLGGVAADRVQHEAGDGGYAVIYLHGGGYVAGSPRVQGAIPAHIGLASGATVYALDYRLAPEHPFPAALDDARGAYEWLVERGADPARVALIGDSAGGGLALATALAARDTGLPSPGALVLISPWVDLTLGGETMDTKAGDDAMLTRAWLADCARLYAGGAPLDDPAASPLFGELTGLPPTLIQVGTREVLLSDAERLAERAAGAGVDVELQRFEGLGHAFQLHAGVLNASDRAIARVAEFVAQR